MTYVNGITSEYPADRIVVSPKLLAGVLAIAGGKAYRNGTAETGAMTDHGGNIRPVWIGGRNNNGSTYGNKGARFQAVAFYSTILLPAQITALTAAINDLPPFPL